MSRPLLSVDTSRESRLLRQENSNKLMNYLKTGPKLATLKAFLGQETGGSSAMSVPLKHSLKLKMFLAVGLFYLAAIGTLTYLTVRSQKNLLLAQMRERATLGVNLIELSVTGTLYDLDTRYDVDTRRLETIAREAKLLPNVEYVYIFDDQGRIIGDFHPDRRQLLDKVPDGFQQPIVTAESATFIEIDYAKEILDVSKQVYLGHDKFGGIRLGFNLKPMVEETKTVTVRAVGISTAIFLVGLIVIFIITMRTTKPIERLTVAAKRIEEGDLHYRVSIHRDDEIGSLAAAFDQMAERLMQREKELKQSHDTLRRADRLSSLGLLTAGLAHEIRNPLVAIRTFTQLLPERYQDAEFREGFQGLALKEVDRICGLINDLLAFARPSRPNVAEENMNEVVDGIGRILETQAKEKAIEIKRDFATDLPRVWIDREQMKQVFMNLILNAIQAMGEGGSLVVSTRLYCKDESEENSRYIQVEIRDTGVGISEENLEHIFDPFFTNKDEGSGLGLSISHQIVQEHGGYIVVESKVGQGTSFFINLPVGKPVRPGTNGRARVNEANSHHR
jgi:signal transduction histidine kinase